MRRQLGVGVGVVVAGVAARVTPLPGLRPPDDDRLRERHG
jgi:hypothetical protein